MSTQERTKTERCAEVEENSETTDKVDPAVIEAMLRDVEELKRRPNIPLSWEMGAHEAAYAEALAMIEKDPTDAKRRAEHKEYLRILNELNIEKEEGIRVARNLLANRPPTFFQKAGRAVCSAPGLLAQFMVSCVTVPYTALASFAGDASTVIYGALPTIACGLFGGLAAYWLTDLTVLLVSSLLSAITFGYSLISSQMATVRQLLDSVSSGILVSILAWIVFIYTFATTFVNIQNDNRNRNNYN